MSKVPVMASRLDLRREGISSEWREWKPSSLSAHFDECTLRWPETVFLISERGSIAYLDLVDLSWRYTAALARAEVGSGDRIGLLMLGGADVMAVKVAAARLGAVVLPINYLLTPGELRVVLDGARPRMLIAHARVANVEVVELMTLAGVLLPPGSTRVILESEEEDAPHGFEDLAAFLQDSPAIDRRAMLPPTDEALAEILYTSGSTGIAKGVKLRHQPLLREAFGTALTRALTPGWRTLTALPTFHLFGYAQAVLPVTFVGGCVVVRGKFDAVSELEEVQALGIADIVCIPSTLRSLVELAEQAAPCLDSLVAVFAAGDPVPEALWIRARRALGISDITNGYGMTELSGTSFMLPPDASDDQLAQSVGTVKSAGHVGIADHGGAQHEVRIVDPGTLEPVPTGESGELQYRGPNLFAGYWEDPEETARVLTEDGWFRSGDTGRLRPDGALVLTGRIKDLFRTGGELVSPAEVEGALADCDGVSAAFVVGVPDDRWGEIGWAFVVPVTDGALSVEAVIGHCRRRLAKYKVPRQIRVMGIDELPKTASGKIHKAALIGLAHAERLDPVSVPPGQSTVRLQNKPTGERHDV